MSIIEEITQHLHTLPPHLQAQVLDYVLFLQQKYPQASPASLAMNDEIALKIHDKLIDQYAETFIKLAQ